MGLGQELTAWCEPLGERYDKLAVPVPSKSGFQNEKQWRPSFIYLQKYDFDGNFYDTEVFWEGTLFFQLAESIFTKKLLIAKQQYIHNYVKQIILSWTT